MSATAGSVAGSAGRVLTPPTPCPVRSARRRRRSRGLCRDRGRSSRSRAPPSASSATRGRGADAARPAGDRLGRAPDHLIGRHDRVHTQVEGAGRQVLAAPAARGARRPPGTRRRAFVAGSDRRSRRRTPPGGPPRSTATAGVTITSKADGSITAPPAGSRAPNHVSVVGSPGRQERATRSAPSITGSPITIPRPTSASISGIVESSEPNDEKPSTVVAATTSGRREQAIGHRDCGARTIGRIGRVARGQHPPAHLALGALQLARRHDRRVSAIRSSRSGGPAASGTIHVAPAARTRSRRLRRSSTVPAPDVERAARLDPALLERGQLGGIADRRARSRPTSAAPPRGRGPPPAPSRRAAHTAGGTRRFASPSRSTRRRSGRPRARPARTFPRATPRRWPAGSRGPRSAGVIDPPGQGSPAKSARVASAVSSSKHGALLDRRERQPGHLVFGAPELVARARARAPRRRRPDARGPTSPSRGCRAAGTPRARRAPRRPGPGWPRPRPRAACRARPTGARARRAGTGGRRRTPPRSRRPRRARRPRAACAAPR